MKKTISILVLVFCMFLCCCSPLKKGIVSGDNDKTTGEAAENNTSNKISVNTDEQPYEGHSAKEIPDMTKKDDLNEGVEDKPKGVPEAEKLNTTQTPETVKPQPVKPASTKVDYDVKVDISDQRVYVYRNGAEIKAMTCSTGVKGHETPEGTFKIKGRDKWFFSEEFQQGGKYWVGFIGGTYLFHSVPADRNQKIIEEEASKLGIPASHGCVRLSEADAKWFFDTIPDGSKVVIQK